MLFNRTRILRLILLLAAVLATGCSTLNPDNTAKRPWDRPTRWDTEHNWIVQPDRSNQRPGDFYP